MKNLIPTEQQEQITFATWLRVKGILFFHPANGGYRNLFEARNLKRSGVLAGVPDIFICIPRMPYHGLFVEMKRTKGGKVSADQLFVMEELRKLNYQVEVAYGCSKAIQITENYLKLNKWPALSLLS